MAIDAILCQTQSEFPYPGWSLGQLRYWVHRFRHQRKSRRAESLSDLNLVLGSVEDKDRLNDLKRHLESLANG